tara:strand:+ start:1383 stop:2135 length:753 start_codon:yes stop_codon:yes gene_type:complete
MAIIDQLSTSNTFQEWLSTTTELIDMNNQFVEGVGGAFEASSNVRINGDLTVTGNVTLDVAGFDNLSVAGNLILSESGTAPFFNVANTAGVATTRFVVDHSGSAAYIYDTHPSLNPDIQVRPAQTFAFDLQKLNGVHPFVIRTTNDAASVNDGGTYYNVGLTHVQTEGTSGHAGTSRLLVRTGFDAQGHNRGILYWKVPANTAGQNFFYQCKSHAGNMVGNLIVEHTSTAAMNRSNTVISEALALSIALG